MAGRFLRSSADKRTARDWPPAVAKAKLVAEPLYQLDIGLKFGVVDSPFDQGSVQVFQADAHRDGLAIERVESSGIVDFGVEGIGLVVKYKTHILFDQVAFQKIHRRHADEAATKRLAGWAYGLCRCRSAGCPRG
ncbi:MAG: hypothetical protein R2825_21530 [Saprospiraceae bacterium]